MGLGRAGVGVVWCEESWDGRECVEGRSTLRSGGVWRRAGITECGSVWAIQDRVKGSGEGECAVLRRDEELGWVVGVSHAGTGTQSK